MLVPSDIIIEEPERAVPEFVPPFATGRIPAEPGRLFRSDHEGAPAAVFIKIAPVVRAGASTEICPLPFP